MMRLDRNTVFVLGGFAIACGSNSAGDGGGTGVGTGATSATGASGAGPTGTSGGAGGEVATGSGAGGSAMGGSGGATSGGGAAGSPGAGGGFVVDGGGVAGMGGQALPDASVPDSGTDVLDPAIVTSVGSVSTTRIGGAIDMLAGFPTRNACATPAMATTGIVAARDWVRGQFQAIPGLTVSLEPFTFSVTIPMMGTCGPVTDQNVVAVKPGAHPDRVFVIGGHYDSRTVNVVDAMGRAPGANDSGSQTAAVLEIARALAPLSFDATLVFAAFAGEEQGLFGSAQLAKDYKQYVTPNAKIEAMLDLDIVGGDTAANDAAALQ